MRPGEIYYLASVDPIHGGTPKNRRVVIVTEEIILENPIYAVACSSSLLPDEIERAVELPWSRDGQAATGFRKQTWAVPAWFIKLRPSQLGARAGHVPSKHLSEIIARLPADPLFDYCDDP